MARYPHFKKLKKVLEHVIKNKFFFIFTLILVFIIIAVSALAYYYISFNGKIYPNIGVGGIDIGGKEPVDSVSILSQKTNSLSTLTLIYKGNPFEINPSEIDFSYDLDASIGNAYKVTRTGNFIYDLAKRINLLFYPENIDLIFKLNDEKLSDILSVISNQISVKSKDPSVKLINGEIVIDKGLPGNEVDKESLEKSIYSALSKNDFENIEIPVSMVDTTLSQTEIDNLHSRVEKFIGKSLQMKFEFNTFNITDTDIVNLIDPISGYADSSISAEIQKVSDSVNRDSQNPKFTFDNGKVSEFQPALDGIKVDNEKFKSVLIDSLGLLTDSTEKSINFDVPVIKTSPDVTTDKSNNLGIKELIGRGTSTYFHSIPGRVHNVVLAASRINGTLVKPGETFSFNQTLGDVSAFTGYQQAYIISGGKTVLGDGGGVCQVSTTFFRALLNAGLPIVERAAHAYRVGYYEQDSPPGLDATVYGPSPDLKFTNDTPAYILIEATANPKNYSLIFELFGASDGRIATITKPVVSNVTPAPPTLYQDDPTLPAGTLKQTDFAAAGAKVTFNYSVKRDGKEIYNKIFISNYRPWQAVFLRGTGPKQ